jgi:hypothetical protein
MLCEQDCLVMNRIFQMFIDYNLFGMNFIEVDAVKFRQPLPEGLPGVYGQIQVH